MVGDRLFASRPGGQSWPPTWLACAVGIAVAIAYVPFFQSIAHAAGADHHAGHVAYVPMFFIILLLADRDRLRRSRGQREPRGVAVMALAGGILAIGYYSMSVALQGLSLVVALAGLVCWLFGIRTLRALSFTLAFLLFMLPPPRDLLAAVAPGMQRFVAAFAQGVLSAFQMPVQRDGIHLLLPERTLEVVEECAGLRFALIVVVFASALARLVLPTIASQLTLVALALPVAALTNATRVATLTAGAHLIGDHVINGPLHFQIGRAFWVLGLLAVVGIACGLRSARDGHETTSDRPRGQST